MRPQERTVKRRKLDDMDELFDHVSEDEDEDEDEGSDSTLASGEGYDEDDGYDGFEEGYRMLKVNSQHHLPFRQWCMLRQTRML